MDWQEEVYAWRASGVEPRSSRKKKADCSPMEWAMNLEYNKVRRKGERAQRRVYNRKHKLRSRYGITNEQYEAALEECNGCCQICGEAESTGRRLSIDHCHTTQENRGLLCQRCNTAIGMLIDDTNLLENALTYVRGWKDGLVAELLRRTDDGDTRISKSDRP
jgi:hypothetical protein